MPKIVVCRELGPPESLRLEEIPSMPLRPGEVRVAIRAAGINFPDVLIVAGEYQLKPPLPFTPGVEAAGDVVEVDSAAKGVSVGDRVIVKMRHGAYCSEAVVTPAQLTPMPSTFDYAEAATFLAGHGTAYHALIDRGQVKPGEVLLVHGAGGGVGLARNYTAPARRPDRGRAGGGLEKFPGTPILVSVALRRLGTDKQGDIHG